MRIRRAALFAGPGLALLGLAACHPLEAARREQAAALSQDPWDQPEEAIARVGERTLTRRDFYRWVCSSLGTYRLLRDFVADELFVQEAKRRGIAVSDEEVTAAVERAFQLDAERQGIRSPEEAERLARQSGLDPADLKRDSLPRARLELLREKVVAAMRVVSEKDLREHYQRTFAQEQVQARHIAYRYLFPNRPETEVAAQRQEAIEKALRAIRLVRAGSDFAEIARGESEDLATAHLGGDLPLVSRETEMPEEVRQAIFSLKPMDLSEPVDFAERGSIHVFQVVATVPHRSFVEVRAELEAELRHRPPTTEEILQIVQRLQQEHGVEALGRKPSRG